MIMLKLGYCCCFVFPATGLGKSKLVNFLYYTILIPFVTHLLIVYSCSQSDLALSYGVLLITLVTLLWKPTIYARFQRSYWKNFPQYRLRLSLLLFFLCMIFGRQNLLTFFTFFELSLVPIIVILFIGGSSNKKLEAGLYIFAFTSSSAFVFLVFLVLSSLSQHGINTFAVTIISSYNSPLEVGERWASVSKLIYSMATVVILIKTPLFFLHIWLPKAHVEAPVFASIVLARLLLKTGGYGFLLIIMNYYGALVGGDLLVCGGLIMAIFAAVRCSIQTDIKILIAYSRVNHIRVMLCGIILGLRSSALGRAVLIIGHGIISSAIFFLARDRYRQIGTRSSFFSLVLGKSNINIVSWLLLNFINAGLPPFLIFVGEIIIIKAVLIYPLLIFLFFINYILIGYYRCLILVKLVFAKSPANVGRLNAVGVNPYVCNTVVLIHFSLLINITTCYPWLK